MPWLGTFHAICVKLLRRHAELAGLKSNFTILDTDDQVRLMKQLIVAAGIDEKRWPARQLASIIDGWKNRALTPDKIPVGRCRRLQPAGPGALRRIPGAAEDAERRRFRRSAAACHRDLPEERGPAGAIPALVPLHPRGRIPGHQRRAVPVAAALAQGHMNICCVGDDDQSIYGWRGAEVGNILRFEKDFPGAHVVRLEQNYRSTGHILAAASGVIAANKGRLGKTLWTEGEDGEKVRLIGHWDGEEEARWVGEEIEAMGQGTRGHGPRQPRCTSPSSCAPRTRCAPSRTGS
jgi:DNA helicase-2/ATP-dependent DNA helicase PcrA